MIEAPEIEEGPQDTPMTTIDQKSQAEQDALATAVDPTSPVIECSVCGRDCRHAPHMSGGGTAGGQKGERWKPTPRSELRCTSCGGKLHRKESRANQEFNCLVVQAANALGLTVLPHPTPEVVNKMAELVTTGAYKPAPTEREVAHQVGIASGIIPEGTPLPPAHVRTPKEPKTQIKPLPDLKPGEALTEGVEAAPAITIPEALLTGLKKKKTPEEIEAEKAKAKAEREAEKETKRLERDKAREEAKAQKAQERAEAAAARLKEKAAALEAKAAGLTVAVAPKAVAPPEAHETIAVEEANEDGSFADGYNPLMGTVLANDDEDDDEEEELSPAQLKALAKK